jgi:predicted enzyme related to lactoylglutathione lyase
MPTRTDAPVGAPIWILLQTTDEPAARSFYERIFGWEGTPADPGYGGYFTFYRGEDPVAGCSEHEASEPQADTWVTYFASNDAEVTAKAAAAAGAAVLVEPMQINVQGTMAVVADPGGTVVGIWEPNEHRGFRRFGEPGTPGWFDLETRDYAVVVEFYRDVLGWTTSVLSDTDEFRYTMLQVGDEQLAGIMDGGGYLAAHAPTSWTVVFSVEDTDATVDQVLELGGAVQRPAHDSPYGRLATVEDPMGAKFALISGA